MLGPHLKLRCNALSNVEDLTSHHLESHISGFLEEAEGLIVLQSHQEGPLGYLLPLTEVP